MGFGSLFGLFNIPQPPGYIHIISVLLFPFAVIALLITTPAVNVVVKVLKWLIGLTFAAILLNGAYALYLTFVVSPYTGPAFVGEGEDQFFIALILFAITSIELLLMVIEFIALIIAERFHKTPPTKTIESAPTNQL